MNVYIKRGMWIGSIFGLLQLPLLFIFSNWKEVEPSWPNDRENIELFRVFWYTAQKTQYLVSDEVNGKSAFQNKNSGGMIL